ncbi:MAG: hypothetical protein GY936_10405 [Ignavibacteriae bacterium]|nr:hypothetical protein [Ignavibacteriota bacterium]
MKKVLIAIICLSVFVSCKTDKKETQTQTTEIETVKSDELTLNGSFIYFDNAAVLQTKAEIYGVITDSMMHALNEKVKKYKKEETDMVPVSVKAKLSDKTDNTAWEKKIEILEILKVSKPQPQDNQVIKLQ